MNDRDGSDSRAFEQERELTRLFRDALDNLTEDARRTVREEIAATGPRPGEVEDLVRRVVREEAERHRARDRRGQSWATAGKAALIVIVALGAGWGVGRLAGVGGGPGPVGRADLAATPGSVSSDGAAVLGQDTAVADGAVPSRPPTPQELASRFDSLFAARDALLVAAARAVSAPGLTAAVNGWAAGREDQDLVVHNILVQLALRATIDSTVAVDGAVVRRPQCRGETCGALLAYWRTKAGDPRFPPMGEAPASNSDGIALVERVLILEHGGILE